MVKNKKIFCVFILVTLLLLSSCGNSLNSFQDSMNSLKKGDIKQFCSYFDKKSQNNASNILSEYSKLNDEKKNLYLELLNTISTEINSNDNNKLNVTITCVDFVVLRLDMATDLSYQSSNMVMQKYMQENTIQKYIKSEEIIVNMVNEDGNNKIPFNSQENEALVNKLDILNFLRWLNNV